MPLYFHDSISFGVFRLNLSKSGIGISVGVKGFRLGTGPRGHDIRAGTNGVYYRQTLGGLGSRTATESSKATITPPITSAHLDHLPAVTYQTEEGVVMHRIISRPAEELRDASRSEAIQNLNDARGRAGYLLPVVASGAAVLGLLILIKSSIVPVVAVAVLTMIGCVIAHLIRPPTLDRPKAEFSGFAQGDGLVTSPDFVSMIGTLLPIALCGRSSL